MTGKEAWAHYAEYTEQASSVARHLGFAAGGLLWAIRDGEDEWTVMAKIALAIVMLFFVSDLLQYVFASVKRRCWLRAQEIKMYGDTGSIDGEYRLPESLDQPSSP